MSASSALRSQYSDRLNRIQEELLLALASVRYMRANLNKPEIDRLSEFAPPKRAALAGLEKRLEETYFIRLTAEFEDVLKDYPSDYYPAIAVPDNANFDWLISRVFRPKKIIQPALRVQIDEVRRFRNALAHRGEKAQPVPFAIGLRLAAPEPVAEIAAGAAPPEKKTEVRKQKTENRRNARVYAIRGRFSNLADRIFSSVLWLLTSGLSPMRVTRPAGRSACRSAGQPARRRSRWSGERTAYWSGRRCPARFSILCG